MPGLGEGSRRNPRPMNKLIGHWDALVTQKLFETPSIDTWQPGKMHYPNKMNFGCWKRASEVDPRLSLLPRLLSSLCLSDGMERKHFRVERSTGMGWGLVKVTRTSKECVERCSSFWLVCTYPKCDFSKRISGKLHYNHAVTSMQRYF